VPKMKKVKHRKSNQSAGMVRKRLKKTRNERGQPKKKVEDKKAHIELKKEVRKR